MAFGEVGEAQRVAGCLLRGTDALSKESLKVPRIGRLERLDNSCSG